MEGDYHGHRQNTWFLWKEDIKLSDISQLSLVCGDKAPAYSIVFIWVRSFNSGLETGKVAVLVWYHNTAKELFCEAIRKVHSRWQQCITYEGNMWS
jgi:hypothetical protein